MTQYHSPDLDRDEDGWDIATCSCDWVSPPCPGASEAAAFWGQHVLSLQADRLEALEEIRQRVADGWSIAVAGRHWKRGGESMSLRPEVAAVLWPGTEPE